jgi:hypothetical protein
MCVAGEQSCGERRLGALTLEGRALKANNWAVSHSEQC